VVSNLTRIAALTARISARALAMDFRIAASRRARLTAFASGDSFLLKALATGIAAQSLAAAVTASICSLSRGLDTIAANAAALVA